MIVKGHSSSYNIVFEQSELPAKRDAFNNNEAGCLLARAMPLK